jgi:hypothetical protein
VKSDEKELEREGGGGGGGSIMYCSSFTEERG